VALRLARSSSTWKREEKEEEVEEADVVGA